MCFEDQVDCGLSSDRRDPPVGLDTGGSRVDGASLRLKGRARESIKVLGMVTLSDLDVLQAEDNRSRGWIACTTDAVYLEKPSLYDLVIDLTTSTPSKSSRPTLSLSRPTEWSEDGRRRNYKLSQVRFTWSDMKVVSIFVPTDCDSCSRWHSGQSWNDCWHAIQRTTTIVVNLIQNSRRSRLRAGAGFGVCMKTFASSARGSGWVRGGTIRWNRTPPLMATWQTGVKSD